ncbi:hypothetical protein YQE_11338, partial [Dendroctonus ponderosae]
MCSLNEDYRMDQTENSIDEKNSFEEYRKAGERAPGSCNGTYFGRRFDLAGLSTLQVSKTPRGRNLSQPASQKKMGLNNLAALQKALFGKPKQIVQDTSTELSPLSTGTHSRSHQSANRSRPAIFYIVQEDIDGFWMFYITIQSMVGIKYCCV